MYSTRAFQFVRLAILLCIVPSIGVFYLLFAGDADHAHTSIHRFTVRGKQEIFLKTIEDAPIDGIFDNRTLVDLCGSTQWQDGLIVKCEPPYGDAVQVRNVFLNCVRYAIEAGGNIYLDIPATYARRADHD